MSFIRCIGQGWNWAPLAREPQDEKSKKTCRLCGNIEGLILLWLCKLIYLKYMATTSIQSCIINTYQSWICNMYWYAHLLANIVFQVGKSIMETLESERGIIPTKDDPKKITSDPNRSDRSWCTWRVGGEAPPPSPVKLGTSICTSDVFRQHIL